MQLKKRLFWGGLLCVFAVCLITSWNERVEAEERYPSRPINLIVGYPPGGGTDIAARVLAIYLEKIRGMRVNVINKPGGNAIPAVLEVIHANPDGYTLLADIITSYSMLHIALKELPFKPTDRNILGIWAATPNAWMVPPDSPFKTLNDVEAEVKRDPANFTWASLGGPSPQDFCMKQFFKVIGVDVSKTKPVICKGGAQVMVMTAGGHVKLGFSTIATTIPAAKAGNVKVVAVTSNTNTRWPDFPDTPTVQELGYKTLGSGGWTGVSGPLGLSQEVIETWGEILRDITKDTEMRTKMQNVGLEPYFLNSMEAKDYVMKEIEEGQILWKTE